MKTLRHLTYRSFGVKILQDSEGTGFKIGVGRAVWLNENNPEKALAAAKQAIDKKLDS